VKRVNDEELNKFKRQIGESNTFSIGEDEFSFEPLPSRFVPEYMWIVQRDLTLMDDSNKVKFDDEGNIISDKRIIKNPEEYTKDTMVVTVMLIDEMIKQNYPSLPVEFKDKFITKNYFRLQEILFTLNGDVGLNKIDRNKIDRIKELQAKVNKVETGLDKKAE
jgi:hypothetical protein